MRKRILRILLAVPVIVMLQHCKHEPDQIAMPDPGECDTTNVTFDARIQPILQKSNCYFCHSGSEPQAGLDLTDWSQFAYVVETGAFWGAINHLPGYEPMPQNLPKLSDCDLKLIEIWLRDTTWEDPSVGIPCDPDTVYFQNDILPLLQSSCALSGCHDAASANEGVILDSYNNIIITGEVEPGDPGNSEIYEKITEDDIDKIMPPPPKLPLTAEQIAMIRTWIEQGALNNYCNNSGPCDSLNVSFSQTLVPILQNRCYGCHTGSTPQGGISLGSYADVVTVASSGQLLGAITHSPGYEPMPQNGMKLTDCQIAQFRNWIQNGTPNN